MFDMTIFISLFLMISVFYQRRAHLLKEMKNAGQKGQKEA